MFGGHRAVGQTERASERLRERVRLRFRLRANAYQSGKRGEAIHVL